MLPLFTNRGQTPVMVADQPLFILAKKLQWKNPQSENGEESFLVILGAMQTMKMLWSASGNWLSGSGWETALTNSGITTSGRAQCFLVVHHICRTRYMPQVSEAALYVLAHKVYASYVEVEVGEGDPGDGTLPFQKWMNSACAMQPQVDYW